MTVDSQENQDLRMAMGRATDELPPLPDLVPGAVREGRRRRIRSRAVIGAVVVGSVAAIAAPTLLLAPWAGTRTERAGSAWSGEMPLVPSSWPTGQPLAAPTTAYPTVHVTPTGKGEPDRPTRAQAELQYAFKQKVADVLTRLLPPEAGRLLVPDSGVHSYVLASGEKTYNITFRTDVAQDVLGAGSASPSTDTKPNSGLRGSKPCAEAPTRTPQARCADGTLPDGSPVSVSEESYSTGPAQEGMPATAHPAVPMAQFDYKNARVMLAFFVDEASDTPPPLTVEQVVGVVTDPMFLELVDFWRAHPIRF